MFFIIIKIKQDQCQSLITDGSVLAEVNISAEQNKIKLKDLHSRFK